MQQVIKNTTNKLLILILEAKLNEYKASLDDVKSIVVESVEWSLENGSTMTFDVVRLC